MGMYQHQKINKQTTFMRVKVSQCQTVCCLWQQEPKKKNLHSQSGGGVSVMIFMTVSAS